MSFDFAIPKIKPQNDFMHFNNLQECGSFTFVGANGSGKTRLGFFLEHAIEANTIFISAHRALNLDLRVTPSHFESEFSILFQEKGIGRKSDNSEVDGTISSSKTNTLEDFIDLDPDATKRVHRAIETISQWDKVSA